MKTIQKFNTAIILLLVMTIQAQSQMPIETDFTYQGELTFNDQTADGLYDFEISAYDALTNGNQSGSTLSLEAISVSDGIFTLNLNFGDSAFVGNEVYLEINVRENNSGQSFNLLAPRQKLTSTPYAIHAQFVGADAVTGDEILNSSITTQDISNSSITSAKIVNNTVGTNAIDSSEVQRRVNADCSVGSYIRGINEDGTVVCETDATGNSQVTSADIVDGTIIAADIAAHIIGTSEVNSSQIQRRISQNCDSGFYLTGINEDGSVLCRQLLLSLDHAIGYFYSTANSYTSIAIREDTGLPIIAIPNAGIEVYDCSNSICTNGTSRELDGQYTNDGTFSSLAIREDTGFPIISYRTGSNNDGDLMAYNCTDVNCSTGNAVVLDSTGNVGDYTSIAIGLDGNPIISYYDRTNTDLKIYNCIDSNCVNGFDLTLDNLDKVGLHTSIAVRPNGFPIISYYDATNFDLKVFDCSNTNCSSGTSRTLHELGTTGSYTSITIRPDTGFPIISFKGNSFSLYVYDCSDINCSSGTARLLDYQGNGTSVGFYTDITIREATGTPIISYYDYTSKDLKIYDCFDSTCSTGEDKTLDWIGEVGEFTSIAIGHSGNPIISYYDDTNNDIKIYSCADPHCNR